MGDAAMKGRGWPQGWCRMQGPGDVQVIDARPSRHVGLDVPLLKSPRSTSASVQGLV